MDSAVCFVNIYPLDSVIQPLNNRGQYCYRLSQNSILANLDPKYCRYNFYHKLLVLVVYLLPRGVWVQVLPVHVLLRKPDLDRCCRDRVRHVLDAVVAVHVVFIKAPVLNSSERK